MTAVAGVSGAAETQNQRTRGSGKSHWRGYLVWDSRFREGAIPTQLLISIFISLVLSLLAGPVFIRLAWRLGMIDRPAEVAYKIHSVPTPRAGGMVLVLACLAVGSLMGVLWEAPLRSIFLASLIIFGLGAVDDARGMNAGTKILGQLLATAILMQGGVIVQILHSPIPDAALTVFWIVGVTNAYNLVDSMDGEALGLAGLASAFLMMAMASTGQATPAVLAALLIGACGGLLFYNVTPARLFLGDSGSQYLGFWLAALAIVFTPVRTVPQLSSWFVPILIMIVPILDTTLVTISRLRLRVPIYRGSRDHTYHRLVALGVSPQRAVLTIHLSSAAAGCLALIALQLAPIWANGIFLGALLLGLAAIWWLARARSEPDISDGRSSMQN